MKQLYEVGEKVYLQSRSMPQYNGQYIVEAVHAPNTREACKIGKGRRKSTPRTDTLTDVG